MSNTSGSKEEVEGQKQRSPEMLKRGPKSEEVKLSAENGNIKARISYAVK